MSDSAITNAEPIVVDVEAQLFVGDVTASCEYYSSKLGFTVAFAYGDPPFYGQVERNGARLNLRHVDAPVFVDGIREREQLLSAVLTLASAAEHRALFLQYQDRGVDFSQTLTQEPWGAQTFVVRDPDGNLVLFAAPGVSAE